MTTTLGEKTVTARKPHVCGLCRGAIDVGEEHFTQRNADGGDIWTYRAHLKCWSALGAYLKSCGLPPWWDEKVDPDEFHEFVMSREG